MKKNATTTVLEIFEKGSDGRSILSANTEQPNGNIPQIVYCYQAPVKKMKKMSARS